MAENRRPLKVRSHRWSHWLARRLAEKDLSPNEISLFSMAFAALAMVGAICWPLFTIIGVKVFFILLIIIGVQGRLLCNLLDGMVAVEGGKKTPAGELYNDIPDRVSDALILIGLGIGLAGATPFALELGFLATLFAVLTAYIRVLGSSMGTPAYFSGPMAKQHRMALITGGCVLTIICLFYAPDYAIWLMYAVLLLILIGSVFTCSNRIMKIKKFMEFQALEAFQQKLAEESNAADVTADESIEEDVTQEVA